MPKSFFFGYGSLVNTKTHLYKRATPACAKGWRREWRWVPGRELAFLTAIPDSSCEIEGLIAEVPNQDWAALDEREEFYERLNANDCTDHPVNEPLDIAIYAIPPASSTIASDDHPIILSYLDVVLQGYLEVYGVEGGLKFFESTTGWDAPVINDRAAPLYPRSQKLSAEETDWVDEQLASRRIKIINAG